MDHMTVHVQWPIGLHVIEKWPDWDIQNSWMDNLRMLKIGMYVT